MRLASIGRDLIHAFLRIDINHPNHNAKCGGIILPSSFQDPRKRVEFVFGYWWISEEWSADTLAHVVPTPRDARRGIFHGDDFEEDLFFFFGLIGDVQLSFSQIV